MSEFKRVHAFGVRFDLVRFADVIEVLSEKIAQRHRLIVGYMNLHGAYIAGRDPYYLRCVEMFDLIYADGMPLVWWRKLLWGDGGTDNRFTLSQMLPVFLGFASARQYRVYYVGSENEVLTKGIERLRHDHPGLEIGGTHGFFDKTTDSEENISVVAGINAFEPDILLIGMGMPVQEKWIIENADKLTCPVIYATGAAIEYFSGTVTRPPAWISNNGLEWAFRLISQPRKLWRRYLIEPLFLLRPTIKDAHNRMRYRPIPSKHEG